MEQVPEAVDDHLLSIVNAQSSHVEVVENPNSERKRNLVINLWIGYLQQFFPLKYSGNNFFLDSTFEKNFVGFFTMKVARTRGQNGSRFMAIKTLRSLAETFLGVVCRYAHDLRHSRAGPRLIGAAGLYTKVSNLARKRTFSSTLVHVARSTDLSPPPPSAYTTVITDYSLRREGERNKKRYKGLPEVKLLIQEAMRTSNGAHGHRLPRIQLVTMLLLTFYLIPRPSTLTQCFNGSTSVKSDSSSTPFFHTYIFSPKSS